ncbi:lecithin retinol acyltransferase family protein [Pseudomonas sp. CF161]|uniref:lecithin retinol acyltransferase family protein n=1 Tax=Pseudomonas sp. CF161 TaxID=911241 RepID=UPI0005BB4079|nr:lecithin retinol acyltransferase family protein [Pseudomonas sp. CF161]
MDTYPTGTHLVVGRGMYTHHGIYVGRKRVIHYSGMASGIDKGCIESTSLAAFCQDKKPRIRTYKKTYFSGPTICRRARSRLGEDQYNILFNNCEHFANWCVTNLHTSAQVEAATMRVGATLASQLFTRKAAEDAAKQAVTSLAAKGTTAAARNLIAGQATKTIAHQAARSLVGQTLARGAVGTATGLIGTGGVSGLAATGLGAAGIASGAALAPAVATIALAAGAAYAAGRLWDWLMD